MDSLEQEETMLEEPVVHSSPEMYDELNFEDGLEINGDQTWKIEPLSRSPVDMGENSWGHTVPLRLFCYGVRHRYSPAFDQ